MLISESIPTVPHTLSSLSTRSACHPRRRIWPEADITFMVMGGKSPTEFRNSGKSRGSFKGAIRISFRSLNLLFNYLAFPQISRKSLKFPSWLFSTPTAPTTLYFFTSATGVDDNEGDWLQCDPKAIGTRGWRRKERIFQPARALPGFKRVWHGGAECSFLPRRGPIISWCP